MAINTPENIYKGNFKVSFDFKDLTKKEIENLEYCFVNIKDNTISFNLFEIDGVAQPLNIIARIKKERLFGNITINMINKDNNDIGAILFENVEFKEVQNLIDFDTNTDSYDKDSEKTIFVDITSDNIYYDGVKI